MFPFQINKKSICASKLHKFTQAGALLRGYDIERTAYGIFKYNLFRHYLDIPNLRPVFWPQQKGQFLTFFAQKQVGSKNRMNRSIPIKNTDYVWAMYNNNYN